MDLAREMEQVFNTIQQSTLPSNVPKLATPSKKKKAPIPKRIVNLCGNEYNIPSSFTVVTKEFVGRLKDERLKKGHIAITDKELNRLRSDKLECDRQIFKLQGQVVTNN